MPTTRSARTRARASSLPLEERAGCGEGTEAAARPALREVRANVKEDAATGAGKADLRRVDRQLEAMLRAAREDTTPLTPPVRRFFTEPREPKADASDDEEQEQDDGDDWTVEDDGAEDNSQGEGATDGAESLCDALRTLELAPTGSFLRGVPRACGTHVRFDD